jgi:outer membrane protein assembly factor BamB
MSVRIAAVVLATVALLVSACGGSSSSATGTMSTGGGAARTNGAKLTDWPEFGLNPQRTDATSRPTGITAKNVGRLRVRQVSLPGTVDSSPIYLHGLEVAGASHDVVVVTTTYGRTLALDADSGRRLWTHTPAGYGNWAGSAQITTTSPIADPDRRFVYSASPNGLIHKLALSSGHEVRAGAWPASITRDATREKLGSALNIAGPDVIATTSGYIGDAPTYQGHLALISRASGRVTGVFNTLCADRHKIIVPGSCPESGSAILSRGGAVVEPGSKRLLISTGNGAWNGRTDFGDSVLELTVPGLRLRQAFTPANQRELEENDTDLGSSAPALLGHGRVMVAGKDGVIRVLDLRRLDGHAPSPHHRLGGELQTLKTPGGGELFTAPAVWHHGSQTTVFIADDEGTAAFALRRGRLHPLWSNSTPGTSPVLAGGLLYVYDPSAGGIEVYSPASGNPIAKLPGSSGHWNSPIVVDGHVVEPEGDANEHATTGTLKLFSVR